MTDVLAQVAAPEAGQELYWLLGLLATAVVVLFGLLMRNLAGQITDWKDSSKTATKELSETVATLRTVSDAVDRHGRDAVTAIAGVGVEVQKITETVEIIDRRLERLESRGERYPTDRPSR